MEFSRDETGRRSIRISAPAVGEEEWLALREPIDTGWLTQGPKVGAFESAFAARHQVPHAVATTSGTTALHLALAALGIGPGDEVIVPAFTWVATANAVVYCGATPVFADVLDKTFNVDPEAVRDAVSPRTRAVVPVHLFGLCADMDAVRGAVPSGIPLIEDAACAAGAAYHGIPAGGLGQAGCFSFHPRKAVTTGEGGMLTTTDGDLAARAEQLRNHGAQIGGATDGSRLPVVEIDELGFNYRMSDLQAALGLVQLKKLDEFLGERDRWARWYAEALADLDWLVTPQTPPGYEHAWQSYVTVLHDDAPLARDELMQRLDGLGVSTRIGTHAVTELGYYRDRFDVSGSCPTAATLQEQSLAIPLHNRMSADDYAYVVEAIHAA